MTLTEYIATNPVLNQQKRNDLIAKLRDQQLEIQVLIEFLESK